VVCVCRVCVCVSCVSCASCVRIKCGETGLLGDSCLLRPQGGVHGLFQEREVGRVHVRAVQLVGRVETWENGFAVESAVLKEKKKGPYRCRRG